MSPARARTSRAAIVAAGRDLLEAGGVDAVTMQAVARQIGIRAPSLYKWFPSRDALIASIGADALADLGAQLAPFGRDPDPSAGVRALAVSFRAFAHDHPRAYGLLFADLPANARPPVERYADASAPLIELTRQLVGPDQALEAARLVTAFAHGFVTMELSGAFRLGGDVGDAYRYGVEALIEALAGQRPPRDLSDAPGRRGRG